MTHRLYHIIYIAAGLLTANLLIVACSTTSALKDDEQLFTGLKQIEYTNYEPGAYADSAIMEVEAALASAPNNALFGSSYYRTPLPIGLWVWNAFSPSDDFLSKWMVKAFGSKPKLMQNVNPTLRAQVAHGQLKKYGYFNSRVGYEQITLANPKKGKVAYHVDMGHLWTLDTLTYEAFPADGMWLIDSTRQQAYIRTGSPFNVSKMELERQRLTRLFRNNGYYYYANSYASYLADTVNTPGKVSVKLMLADSIPAIVTRQWYIGHLNINFKNSFMEQPTDSFVRPYLNIRYSGKKMPIRAGVVLRDLHLRPRQLYKVENEELAKSGLQATGLFSYTNLKFAPRDTTALCDTLDATLDLIFDKPYDFYVEANGKGKTTGRMGPELVVGFTKRNAFRGGEKLDINLHGSHEWQTAHQGEGSSSKINSYEIGGDISVSFPRIVTPFNAFRSMAQNERRFRKGHMPKRYYGTPTTSVKASMNILNRAGYFRRHVVSGELNYNWSASAQHHHSFSPLVLSYEYMNSKTAAFDSILQDNVYLQVSMRDQFVPKMSYTYTYNSPVSYRNPVTWTTTVSEAANIISLGYMLAGRSFNEENKTMFKNPFAQFLKVETDFVKYWRTSETSTLVAHVNAGIVWSYGNTNKAPYYEQFYVGGANSIRAFNIRTIGPGKYIPTGNRYSYIDQTGDVKLLANLEFRPKLFGDLYGAVFLDAGNVWTLQNEQYSPLGKLRLGEFYKQLAVGTGLGVRYDIGMFVIRVDWGVGLHMPYDTGKSGFYNVARFKDAQSLHLAIGYPF